LKTEIEGLNQETVRRADRKQKRAKLKKGKKLAERKMGRNVEMRGEKQIMKEWEGKDFYHLERYHVELSDGNVGNVPDKTAGWPLPSEVGDILKCKTEK
jgi:hypothetical protein